MDVYANLLNSTFVWAAGFALIAGLLHGYTGFGGAVLLVPLLSLFFAPIIAVEVTIIAAAVGQINLALRSWRKAEGQSCAPYLLAAIVAAPASAYLLLVTEADFIRRVIGATTLSLAVILLTGWTYKGRRGAGASALFGIVGGLINGLTGQGGPIAVTYFISAPVAIEVQRANIITAVTGMIVITITSLTITGALDWNTVVLGLTLGLPYTLGTWSGNRLFGIVPKANYRRASLSLIIVAGILALIR
jgi:uncharacterized membrane protein YfcA